MMLLKPIYAEYIGEKTRKASSCCFSCLLLSHQQSLSPAEMSNVQRRAFDWLWLVANANRGPGKMQTRVLQAELVSDSASERPQRKTNLPGAGMDVLHASTLFNEVQCRLVSASRILLQTSNLLLSCLFSTTNWLLLLKSEKCSIATMDVQRTLSSASLSGSSHGTGCARPTAHFTQAHSG